MTLSSGHAAERTRTQTDQLLNELGYDLLGEYKKAVQIAGFDKRERVLDVGTGSGRMAAVLCAAGYDVLSGDIDSEALERARERLGEVTSRAVTFALLDARAMSFYDNAFGSVVCANALHEMQEPLSVLSELARVCKPAGKLVVVEFTDKGFDVIATVLKQTRCTDHRRGSIAQNEIAEFLKAGFACVEHQSLGLNNVWTATRKR